LLKIAGVGPESIAAALGLRYGDRILAINGESVNDVVDYRFHIGDEQIALTVQKRSGAIKNLRFTKPPDDDLGIEFPLFQIKHCGNHCIFCFVDQMPPDCRSSLYVKDDDYRASFLFGNYITLSALSEADLARVFKQRLSPLYVSVHATEPELRAFILGNQRAPDILARIKQLADGGIRMHTQIVTCPGVNDGRHLEKTIEDLSKFFPSVMSIAVVPVGITAYRSGLYPVKPFTRAKAQAILVTTKRFGTRYLRQFGTRLVFASDEFFIKAGAPFPPASCYEEFPQIENGVGMVSAFLRSVSRVRVPARISPLRVTVVTGVSFGAILKASLLKLKQVKGLVIMQITVKNRFFGKFVTVAGLLTGGDIMRALRGKRLGDLVLIPSNVLMEEEPLFLDNMSLAQMEKELGVRVCAVSDFKDLIHVLRGKE